MLVPYQSEYRSGVDLGDPCLLGKDQFINSDNNKLYDQCLSFPTRELDRIVYLQSISYTERHAIAHLFLEVIDSSFLFYNMIGIMAVGTTTYPNSYWARLEKMFIDTNDSSRLPIIERRGEDIDLLLITELPGATDSLSPIPQNDSRDWWTTKILGYLDDANIQYKHQQGKYNDGTDYLVVPEIDVQNIGEKTIRRKLYKYDDDSITIYYHGCRPLHLRFESRLPALDKLKMERCSGGCFSLIMNPCDLTELRKAIAKIDQQRTLFDGDEPYTKLPFDEKVIVKDPPCARLTDSYDKEAPF